MLVQLGIRVNPSNGLVRKHAKKKEPAKRSAA
jgi:hypothetical protein